MVGLRNKLLRQLENSYWPKKSSVSGRSPFRSEVGYVHIVDDKKKPNDRSFTL